MDRKTTSTNAHSLDNNVCFYCTAATHVIFVMTSLQLLQQRHDVEQVIMYIMTLASLIFIEGECTATLVQPEH